MTEPTFATDRLQLFVQNLLATLVQAASDLGVDIPSRQIAGAGQIPSDCEQVVVTCTQVTTGAPEAAARAGSGAGTYPNPGANNTIYTVTIQMAIVRQTNDTPTVGIGVQLPGSNAYLINLEQASGDAGLLISATDAMIESMIVGAAPRTVTIGNPTGGLVSTSIRITAVI